MPYISIKLRKDLRNGALAENAGQLNYQITTLVDRYLMSLRRSGKNQYADYNEAIGVLECAKLELYRRLVAKYEDRKLKENGDVYCG